ncbi:FliM/FliN family flagellar motor switch protein [Providencia sp. 21OH12SH02B-Prov]|uniref:FliM/FliN family flagellar motor switch protein n=1 Tax=Providencia sp. 21OH12SH02B-Prov TaxID=3015951 RepID=UPI0022B65D69|nr:FliM/FliN family flagellar motor switch protein [Providencia sp. 21OH12SH02B-Prov]WBA56960.1 FliM/FliN family flagellar motor switch protein [Providencia sp. 21OH12SH02B-Prov]
MLNIRRISPREVQMRALQQRYQPDADVVVPKSGERYFRLTLVSEKETVQGLMHVGEWCDYRWPTLIHYAWDALNEADLVSLFHSEYPRTLFFSERFRCRNIEIIDDESVTQHWLCVHESHLGKVLLSSPINGVARQPVENRFIECLRLQADWILGHSDISVKLLQSIELHDVLYIQKLQLHMSIAGRLFARFQKQQEGQFMIEEMIDSETENNTEASTEALIDEVVQPFDVNTLSVKLTFVLGHSEITINELANMQLGSIYSIGENKEREVKVYANKQFIAEGELIYIGDSDELGLEITRLGNLGDRRL